MEYVGKSNKCRVNSVLHHFKSWHPSARPTIDVVNVVVALAARSFFSTSSAYCPTVASLALNVITCTLVDPTCRFFCIFAPITSRCILCWC